MGIVDKLRRIDCTHGDASKAADLIEKMGEVLKDVEWTPQVSGDGELCRVCWADKTTGHDKDCKLAACLKDLQ